MFGVRPEKMTPEDAVAILKQHPMTRGMTFRKGSSETAFLDGEYEFAGENGKIVVYKRDQIVFLCTDDLAQATLPICALPVSRKKIVGRCICDFWQTSGIFP